MSKIPLPPPTAMPLPPATGNVPPPPPKVIEGEFIPAMIKAPPPPTRAEPELITPELITNNNAPIAGGEFTRVKKANPHELVLVNGRLCVTNLHDYQVRTVNHQLRCIDSMLWLGLGLGKTVSTLTTIVERMRRGTLKRTLIVAPLRVCQLTWKHEADTWDHTKHLTFANMFGSAKDRQRALFSQKDIYLINFESLGWLALQLTEYFINQGLDLPFEMIVFDEISKMKRPESQRFKDFAPVIPFFKSHTGLTASPASNGLHNMWGQYYVIDQGKRLGENYNTFKNRFFYQAEGTRGKTIEHDDSRELLIERVSDITIEIPAEGNIELPDFQEIDVMVKLTPKLMRDYLTLEEEFVLGLENGDELEVFNAASLANKLLQFSSELCTTHLIQNLDLTIVLSKRSIKSKMLHLMTLLKSLAMSRSCLHTTSALNVIAS